MKNLLLILLLCTFLLFSCKSTLKADEEDKQFFPALSYIKSQIAQVDTSVYKIIKVVTIDNISDTSFVKREDFKKEANDFLSLPDIASADVKDDYTETKSYDPDLKQVSLIYMPKNEGALSMEQVLITPDNAGDKVSSFYFKVNSNDSQKALFWYVDKRFKIITISSQPEKKQTVEVIWNDYPSAQ